MKCPLCQIKTDTGSLLPYMGIEICENCWNLKNPDLDQSKNIQEPRQSHMEQKKSTQANRPEKSHAPQKSHAIEQLQKIHAELKLIRQSIPDSNLKIKNLDIPFYSMVVFMIKWTIAAIPAMVILLILFLFLFAVFGEVLENFFLPLLK